MKARLRRGRGWLFTGVLALGLLEVAACDDSSGTGSGGGATTAPTTGAGPTTTTSGNSTGVTTGSGSSSTGMSTLPTDDVGDGNFEVGPDYETDPDLTDLGAPQGMSFSFAMDSQDSEIFKGDDTTLNPENQHPFTRTVYVYIPASYQDGDEAPLLVIQDGPGPLDLVSRALDNLTISSDPDRRLPSFVAIAVENGGGDGKGSERGL
ncbi:MAG: hypothetical protein HOV80_14525 [Polyangiaceae bacterium]|nr:hypothetical protein [Polyangiaceae bacterium]